MYQLAYGQKKSYSKQYSQEYFQKNKESLLQKQRERYNKVASYCKITSQEYIGKLNQYKEQHIRQRESLRCKKKRKDNSCPLSYPGYLEKVVYYRRRRYAESHNAGARRRGKLRRATDPVYNFTMRVRCNISSSFSRACKGNFKKQESSISILGCSFEFFLSHIASQFTEGMTLENYGQWHLDHIVPLATATTREDIVRLNHYTNFQPLWAKDNLSKGAKLI